MAPSPKSVPTTRHYFVDEAGDGTLFNRRGQIIVGTPGCSNYFILGLLDVADPLTLARDLDALRAELLADPYFAGVPSMQPQAQKTALAFHAKDDLPEVRHQVFHLLLRHDLRFLAVVRDKHKLLDYVRQRNQQQAGYRYHPNELYDYLIRRLFKNLLHKDDHYHVCFAKRGRSDRTAALRQALHAARQRFTDQSAIATHSTIHVLAGAPAEHAGLQAADYFLWALQRLYERHEERFVALLWPAFRLVHDLDDTRQARYGVYYTKKRPLTLAALQEKPGI